MPHEMTSSAEEKHHPSSHRIREAVQRAVEKMAKWRRLEFHPYLLSVLEGELAETILKASEYSGNHGSSMRQEAKMEAWGPVWLRMAQLEKEGYKHVWELLNRLVDELSGDKPRSLTLLR